MTERVFDWRPKFDSRSKNYSIRSTLKGVHVPKEPVAWKEGIVLDQGREGACVGFAWTGELLAEPAAPKEQPAFDYANDLAKSFYYSAQKIDEWPGENYSGTSVLAGAKIMQEKGFINEYRWCFNTRDIREAVITEGPVVLGIPWYEGMYSTQQNGLVSVSGKKVGGHAILITGYYPKMRFGKGSYEVFRWRNSWGSDYGINGSGWIKVSDLQKLLEEGGEACVPMQRSIPVLKEPRKSVWYRLFNK